MFVNVIFMVLNLLPLPPLDGGRILVSLLPHRLAYQFARIEPYGFIILIALLFTGVLGVVMWPLIGITLSLIAALFGVPAVRSVQTCSRASRRSKNEMLCESRFVRHAPHRAPASRPLPRRAQELGALQHEYECFFFVADWHALTTHYDDAADDRAERVGHGDRLARRRRRSGAGDAVHPVARAASTPNCICCCR